MFSFLPSTLQLSQAFQLRPRNMPSPPRMSCWPGREPQPQTRRKSKFWRLWSCSTTLWEWPASCRTNILSFPAGSGDQGQGLSTPDVSSHTGWEVEPRPRSSFPVSRPSMSLHSESPSRKYKCSSCVYSHELWVEPWEGSHWGHTSWAPESLGSLSCALLSPQDRQC